jgi:hypothetical protein
MATDSADAIRAELDALGERREALNLSEEALMAEVENVVGRAYGIIPVTECARRLKMHRTTVYRVYHPQAA